MIFLSLAIIAAAIAIEKNDYDGDYERELTKRIARLRC